MTVDKNLLMHWWHFYNKDIYTLEELEQFGKIIDQYGVDKIFECAVASFISGDGSPMPVLSCIRCNCVEALIDTLPDISAFTDGEKSEYDNFCKIFIEEISSTL